MPGLSGYELCSKIKESQRMCHIMVVLLTAKTSHEEQIAGLESGGRGHQKHRSQPLRHCRKDRLRLLFLFFKGLQETLRNLAKRVPPEIALRRQPHRPWKCRLSAWVKLRTGYLVCHLMASIVRSSLCSAPATKAWTELMTSFTSSSAPLEHSGVTVSASRWSP